MYFHYLVWINFWSQRGSSIDCSLCYHQWGQSLPSWPSFRKRKHNQRWATHRKPRQVRPPPRLCAGLSPSSGAPRAPLQARARSATAQSDFCPACSFRSQTLSWIFRFQIGAAAVLFLQEQMVTLPPMPCLWSVSAEGPQNITRPLRNVGEWPQVPLFTWTWAACSGCRMLKKWEVVCAWSHRSKKRFWSLGLEAKHLRSHYKYGFSTDSNKRNHELMSRILLWRISLISQDSP